jgi:exopolysaccharide production protein ExoQ
MTRTANEWIAGEPRPIEWMAFVMALIVQQGAFVSLPIVMQGLPVSATRDFDNPVSRYAIALSLLCIGCICAPRLRDLFVIARRNRLTMLYIALVVCSIGWSIHPDISMRRALGYILTVSVAILLPLRFGVDRFMKVLSLSFAVSAVCSLVLAVVAPQYGIMQEGDLAGCWQGVFCTKEALGSVMAVAVFVESYLLSDGNGQSRWRYGLLALYFVLVMLSHSMTALLTAVGFLSGAYAFHLWKRDRGLGRLGIMAICSSALMALTAIRLEPKLTFGLLGKDSTLTGRTILWPLVIELIDKKPLLGWGYRAMWQSTDTITRRIDSMAGFTVPSAHNAFLEIALELGGIGVVVLVLLMWAALRRGAMCLARGFYPLGWFSIMFVVGIVMAGVTTETLGLNQVIEWVVFNALLVSCGTCLNPSRECE